MSRKGMYQFIPLQQVLLIKSETCHHMDMDNIKFHSIYQSQDPQFQFHHKPTYSLLIIINEFFIIFINYHFFYNEK